MTQSRLIFLNNVKSYIEIYPNSKLDTSTEYYSVLKNVLIN